MQHSFIKNVALGFRARPAAGKGNYGKVPEAMKSAKQAKVWIKEAGGKVTHEKREIFIDDLDKGCFKHPNRLSRSKPWNPKKSKL